MTKNLVSWEKYNNLIVALLSFHPILSAVLNVSYIIFLLNFLHIMDMKINLIYQNEFDFFLILSQISLIGLNTV